MAVTQPVVNQEPFTVTDEYHDANPVNPLPSVISALALVIAGVELVLQAAENGLIGGATSIGWRSNLLNDYAFFGSIQDWMIAQSTIRIEFLVRYISYPFVHYDFMHALFAIVMVLAIGKMVAEVLRTVATLLIFVLCSITGAAAYGFFLDETVPLVGAFPAVYGLIGAYTYLMWISLETVGENRWRAFSMVGFLLGIQLLFKLFFGGANDWVADLTGFATGFVIALLISPLGIYRLRQALSRLRQR
jgi:rhomboid protease GluP